jgi:hypothetical protein
MSLKLYIEPYGSNDWTASIIQYLPHSVTTIDDCDYIVSSKIPYGTINCQTVQEALQSYRGVHKRVIVFMLSDINEPFDVPPNILFFRAGMYRSQRKPNEYLIPHIWSAHGLGDRFEPLPKRTIHPLVGFCGTMTSHPCRVQHINKIQMTPDIKKKFIIRSEYWAGKPHDKQVIKEFVNNIKDTHFTLSSRGAGNWSARFYQVLYLGRIPIVVDTDLVMPFEDKINWRDLIVFCDYDNELPHCIKNFWSTRDIIHAQMKCKEIYDTYLTPENWCKIIATEILIPMKDTPL